MDIRTTFIAHSESAELMQPRKRTLNHPPINTQATAMPGVASRQEGFDVPLVQRLAMGLRIRGTIPLARYRVGSEDDPLCPSPAESHPLMESAE